MQLKYAEVESDLKEYEPIDESFIWSGWRDLSLSSHYRSLT